MPSASFVKYNAGVEALVEAWDEDDDEEAILLLI